MEPANCKISHGIVKFDSQCDKTAKYAVVPHTISEKKLKKFCKDVLIDLWKMKEPKLIISVTGGAQKFKMKKAVMEEFRKSLFKAAVSTEAWIVSGGTHTGVMEHVGDAIAEHVTSQSREVVVLGIATYGIVDKHVDLKNAAVKIENCSQSPKPVEYSCSEATSLDENHSHFILVDDGSKEFGGEIELRAKLESYIASLDHDANKKSPIVCILLQGGPGSLKTVYNAISNETPIVVIKSSGGWANILAALYAENSDLITENRISELISEHDADFEPSKLSVWTNMAREIIKRKKLVTIFALDDDSSALHLDTAILQAVLSCTPKVGDTHLKLALAWNRHDIADSNGLIDEDKIGLTKLRKHFFEVLQEPGEKKSAFIQLFLQHGLKLHKDSEIGQKRFQLYTEPVVREGTPLYKLSEEVEWSREKVLSSLMGSSYDPIAKLKEQNKHDKFKENEVLREFFQWAIVMNKKNIAKIFWNALSEDKFSAAIAANKLLTGLKKYCTHEDQKTEYQKHAQIYRDLSLIILNKCYENNPEFASKLLIRKLECLGNVTCLQLAVDTNDRDFVAHQAVQHLLHKIWLGGIIDKEHKSVWYNVFFCVRIFLCAFCPILIALGMVGFEQVPKETKEKGVKESGSQGSCVENSCTKIKEKIGLTKRDSNSIEDNIDLVELDRFSKMKNFHKAPIVKFYLNFFFYLVYLFLFAYVLLINSFSSSASGILVAWVIVLTLDKVQQILDFKDGNFFHNIWHWADKFGNKLDLLSFMLFTIGFIMRYIMQLLYAAEVFWVFSFIFYCIRVLNLFTVHDKLGPILLMVGKMMKKIQFFFFIWAVFLVAYGVASQSLLYPDESRVGDVFFGIFSKPYWQIYGELFLSEIDYNPNTDEFSCTNNASLIDTGYRRCPEQNALVPILSAVYMLLANVLLLNLLIAMFSNTFEKVVSKTRKIWRFQRYDLIKEYYYRPFLVVPFSIIYYVCFRSCVKNNPGQDDAFVKELSEKELIDLLRWEHFLTDSYLQEQKLNKGDKVLSKIQKVSDRLESKIEKLAEDQKRFNKDVLAQVADLQKFNESSLQWIISALKGKDTVPPKHQPKPVHVKALTLVYPKSNPEVKRQKIEDHLVPWSIPMNDYNPPHYTAPEVLGFKPDKTKGDKPSWADNDLDSEPRTRRYSIRRYNQFDHKLKVDRTSYEQHYDVVDGLPRNPKGRTGLAGRGLLGRYGPNHAFDPIVTKWQKGENGCDVKENGKRVLEFIAIKRQDTGEWAIPGILKDPEQDICGKLQSKYSKNGNGKTVEDIFRLGGEEVYRGYVDDHRNTDNAWVESIVCNYHDEDGSKVSINPAKDENLTVEWKTVDRSLKLFADHEKFLKMVADMHKAHY